MSATERFHTENRRIGIERHNHRLVLVGVEGEIVAIELAIVPATRTGVVAGGF